MLEGRVGREEDECGDQWVLNGKGACRAGAHRSPDQDDVFFVIQLNLDQILHHQLRINHQSLGICLLSLVDSVTGILNSQDTALISHAHLNKKFVRCADVFRITMKIDNDLGRPCLFMIRSGRQHAVTVKAVIILGTLKFPLRGNA